VAKVEKDERGAEPVGVAAPGRDLRQILGAQRVVAGGLAFVGGRLPGLTHDPTRRRGGA